MAGRFSVQAVFKAVDRVTAPVSRMQSRVGKFTRGISRGLRTANRQVGRLVNGMRKGLGRVLKFGGALAGVASAAVITALNRTADSADALAKRARRLRFPIEEMQEWQFVAEQSGFTTEEFDKALEGMTKRIGEARSAQGSLFTFLKKTDPQLLRQVVATEDMAGAMDLLIGRLREVEDPFERAALANAAFGRQGLKMSNIAELGADRIRALRMEQRENGNITLQQAEAAEDYNDALNSLKRSITGLIQQTLLHLTPLITENVRKWREWTVANRELIQTRIIDFARNLWGRVKDLVAAVSEFNEKYDMPARLSEGLDVLGKFARFLGENGMLILKLMAGIVALSAVLKTLAFIMTAVNLVMAANPITLVVIGVLALIAALTALGVWLWSIRDSLAAFARTVADTVVGAVRWLRDAFLELPGPVQAAIALVTGPIGMLAAAAALITDNWGGVKDFFADLWGGVTDTFDRALGKITAIADKVKNVAGGIVDRISSIGGGVASFFGFGDDDEDEQRGGRSDSGRQVVSPQERTARSIEEQRTASTAEVTIRDESGRAEVTRGRMGQGVKLQPSGAF